MDHIMDFDSDTTRMACRVRFAQEQGAQVGHGGATNPDTDHFLSAEGFDGIDIKNAG